MPGISGLRGLYAALDVHGYARARTSIYIYMPSLVLGPSCCLPPSMAGQGPFWCQLGLLQCSLGFRGLYFYAFGEQPGFEAPFWVPSDMLD